MHRIVEVRRLPLTSQRRRRFMTTRNFSGWTRVASPFMVRFANSQVWHRVYVNQEERSWNKRTYYTRVNNRWLPLNYGDIAVFVASLPDPAAEGDFPYSQVRTFD